MNKKGFTLVEILAVVAILAILVIVAVPNVVKLFNEGSNDTMTIQENQVLDASKLYLEDYCRSAISSEHLKSCADNRHLISSTEDHELVYFCLDTIKNSGYIKDAILYKSDNCDGIVVFNRSGKTYSDGKVYLYCGNNSYSTDGYSIYKNAFSKCEINVN